MESFQQSLWDVVKELVPGSELGEVRSALGDGLMDLYLEIYSEVQMWEGIWRDVQGVGPRSPRAPLADPPVVKELLRAELQLLLLNLRERASRLGRDEDEAVSRYNRRVVSYALAGRTGSPDDWRQTAVPPGSPGPRTSRCDSRSSSRLSSHSSCEDEIEALSNKLNITHIDEVVSNLRSIFTDECEALKRDVQFLQESVELEYQKQMGVEEPTLTELREERRIIQRDLDVQSVRSEASAERLVSGSFTDLPATHSNLDNPSASLVPPSMNLLLPKPSPPDISRPSPSIQPRHRISLKVLQPLPSSPPGGQPHKPDPELLCTSPNHRASTASTTEDNPLVVNPSAPSAVMWCPSSCSKEPTEEELGDSRLNRAAGPDHGQLRGSIPSKQPKPARTVVLLPTPPAGQKAASRGQRANRQLALLQAGSS